VPIVRDDDGLALSSRNAYLSAEERSRALALSSSLAAGRDAALRGAPADEVLETARGMLGAAEGVDVDYLVLVDPATVDDVPPDHTGPALLLVAARVGTTRLIDTMAVELDGAVSDSAGTGRTGADGPATTASTTTQHRTTGGTP